MEDIVLTSPLLQPQGHSLSSGLSPSYLDDESSFISDFPALIAASSDLYKRQSDYCVTPWLWPLHCLQESVNVSQDLTLKTKYLSCSVTSTQSLSGCPVPSAVYLSHCLSGFSDLAHSSPSTGTVPHFSPFLSSLPGFLMCLESSYDTFFTAPHPQDRADDSRPVRLQYTAPSSHFHTLCNLGRG